MLPADPGGTIDAFYVGVEVGIMRYFERPTGHEMQAVAEAEWLDGDVRGDATTSRPRCEVCDEPAAVAQSVRVTFHACPAHADQLRVWVADFGSEVED
jgi:hypothetical protein